MREQILVHPGFQRPGMAERRDAADGKAGDLAHPGRVGPLDRFAQQGGDPVFVDPVGAAHQQQHGPPGAARSEYQRFDDLADAAAAGFRRFLRRPRQLRMDHDGDGQAGGRRGAREAAAGVGQIRPGIGTGWRRGDLRQGRIL